MWRRKTCLFLRSDLRSYIRDLLVCDFATVMAVSCSSQGVLVRAGLARLRHRCIGAFSSSIAGFNQRWWCVPLLEVVARGGNISAVLVLVVYGRTDALL